MSSFLSTWFHAEAQNHPRGRNSNRRALTPNERHYLRLVREDNEPVKRRPMSPLDVYMAFLLLEDRWAEVKRDDDQTIKAHR